MPEIELSEDLFQRLDALSMPLVPTVPDVIGRLLEHYLRTTAGNTAPAVPPRPFAHDGGSPVASSGGVTHRMPRERGATIQIDNHTFRVISVRDMYEQALKFFVDNGHAKALKALLPLATSSQRYLIAERPKHPNGNDFVITVKHAGFFMEAHKSYKTAIEQLGQVAEKLGLQFKYVGKQ